MILRNLLHARRSAERIPIVFTGYLERHLYPAVLPYFLMMGVTSKREKNVPGTVFMIFADRTVFNRKKSVLLFRNPSLIRQYGI
jgi:hypothetical protein